MSETKPPEVAKDGIAKIRSAAAQTKAGQPLSLNRAPAPDIAPWVARVYATQGETQNNEWLECGILADTHIVRILLAGEWEAETADGIRQYGRDVLFFGPHSRRMIVRVKGAFRTVGVALRAGAGTVLGGPPASETVDQILGYDDVGGNTANLLARFDAAGDPAQWMDELEQCFTALIEEASAASPDPIASTFEAASFADPSQTIANFAKAHDISTRQLERIVRRDFGITPKQVMRRARVLDLAADLVGVAEQEEAEELALRYFDQSHINRDFLEFFGMTPMRFLRTPQPLMTMTLEQRQARRLEETGRIEEGAPRPWE